MRPPAHERVLRFLSAGRAVVSQLGDNRGFLLEQGEGRRLSAQRQVLAELLDQGLTRLAGKNLELTEDGQAHVRRGSSDGDRFAGQHRDLSAEAILVEGERRNVVLNHNESPLAALTRRKDKSGAPFLEQREARAGERLRTDYTRGQIMPRLGANWEANVASGRRDGGRGIADLTDSALAARRRVEGAIDAVGPELSGVLIDVCCFLKGLETVEIERGWPVRSAKIVLKAALSALSRHYEPQPRAGRVVHWGGEGYRPEIGG